MLQVPVNKKVRILYAIQGTGNGHIARATTLIPEIRKYADVDVLLSGLQVELSTAFKIDFRLKGLGFIFGKRGGIDVPQMLRKINLLAFFKEVKDLDLSCYDLVLNDFEPVSAWACKLQNVPCIQISHQTAVKDPNAPKPERGSLMGSWILKNYAPSLSSFGFHFQSYAENIFTPIIRDEVRSKKSIEGSHYTVYLPAYDDKYLVAILKKIKNVHWEVFSKRAKSTFHIDNVKISPIKNEDFIESISGCAGVLCGAGFETPTETLFLGKKLVVIPMSNQYEQQCNAVALEKIGVLVLKELHDKYVHQIEKWVCEDQKIHIYYPDNKGEVVRKLLAFANQRYFQNQFTFNFDVAS